MAMVSGVRSEETPGIETGALTASPRPDVPTIMFATNSAGLCSHTPINQSELTSHLSQPIRGQQTDKSDISSSPETHGTNTFIYTQDLAVSCLITFLGQSMHIDMGHT